MPYKNSYEAFGFLQESVIKGIMLCCSHVWDNNEWMVSSYFQLIGEFTGTIPVLLDNKLKL